MSRLVIALVAVLAANQSVRADFALSLYGVRSGSPSGNVSCTCTGTDHCTNIGSVNGIYFAENGIVAVGQGAGGSNLAFSTFGVDRFHDVKSEILVSQPSLMKNPGANGAPAPALSDAWLGGVSYLYNPGNTATNPNAAASALYAVAMPKLSITGSRLQNVNGDFSPEVIYPPPQSIQPPPVPAPGAAVLLGSGGLCIGFLGMLRRRLGESETTPRSSAKALTDAKTL